MHRPDAEEFVKHHTFGFLPGGTSNGLHKSIVEANQDAVGEISAAFGIVKGKKMQLDLTELELEYL